MQRRLLRSHPSLPRKLTHARAVRRQGLLTKPLLSYVSGRFFFQVKFVVSTCSRWDLTVGTRPFDHLHDTLALCLGQWSTSRTTRVSATPSCVVIKNTPMRSKPEIASASSTLLGSLSSRRSFHDKLDLRGRDL